MQLRFDAISAVYFSKLRWKVLPKPLSKQTEKQWTEVRQRLILRPNSTLMRYPECGQCFTYSKFSMISSLMFSMWRSSCCNSSIASAFDSGTTAEADTDTTTITAIKRKRFQLFFIFKIIEEKLSTLRALAYYSFFSPQRSLAHNRPYIPEAAQWCSVVVPADLLEFWKLFWSISAWTSDRNGVSIKVFRSHSHTHIHLVHSRYRHSSYLWQFLIPTWTILEVSA